MSGMGTLTMNEYLAAVKEHGTDAFDVLAEQHHTKVILAKADKAARKGYTEYGNSIKYAWIAPH